MGIIDQHTAKFMRNLTFFKGLPEADMKAFLDVAQVRTYKKTDALFYQGDQAKSFFVMISGWVKLYRNTTEGEEVLAGLFTRGDAFGEAALFSNGRYPLWGEAAEESRILSIPGEALQNRACKNPDITKRMFVALSREIENLQQQNEQMSTMTAPQRIGCLLLRLSAGLLGTGGAFIFPYDKSLAARLLGMTPETFSRALARLKSFGVISKGSEIKIDSFVRLTKYSYGHHSTTLPGEHKIALRQA